MCAVAGTVNIREQIRHSSYNELKLSGVETRQLVTVCPFYIANNV